MARKIDFTQVLYDFDDLVVEDVHRRKFSSDGRVLANGPSLTLGGACTWALGYSKTNPDEKELNLDEINKYYGLASLIKMSMRNKKPLELDSDYITLLKNLIKVQYTPVIAGQCFALLEGKKAYQPAPASPEPESEATGEAPNA